MLVIMGKEQKRHAAETTTWRHCGQPYATYATKRQRKTERKQSTATGTPSVAQADRGRATLVDAAEHSAQCTAFAACAEASTELHSTSRALAENDVSERPEKTMQNIDHTQGA